MNKFTIFAAASAAAFLSAVPLFAQANQQGGGFVTLDLNWTETGAPAESQMDGDTMRQILERDQARVRMIQERVKAGQVKPEEAKSDTAPVAPPDSSRRTISSDQMRRILEHDRARAQAIGERIRAAQIEADAEKYIKEHPEDFTPGKTPAGWTDNFTAAVGKSKAEKKPILALFTGSLVPALPEARKEHPAPACI